MKKYTFQITEEEAKELTYRVIWEQLRLRHFYWWLLLVLIFIWVQQAFWHWTAFLEFGLILFGLAALYVTWRRSALRKQLCGKTITVTAENGALRLNIEGELSSEVPCGDIAVVRVTRHLLMLGFRQTPKALSWDPIPLRVFADEKEKDAFIAALQNSENQIEMPTEEAGEAPNSEKAGEGGLRFSVRLDEEAGIKLMSEAREINQMWLPGGKQIFAKLLGLAAGMSGLAFFFVICAFLQRATGESIGNILPFMGMILSLSILQYKLGDTEEMVRQQLRKGLLKNPAGEAWEIWLAEWGIGWASPEKKSLIVPWEKLYCTVETESNLFFYLKDGSHLALPKKTMGSGELERVKELCEEKSIKKLAKRRKKYVPRWVFTLLIFLLIMGHVAVIVWQTMQNYQAYGR
ncbi:MAG: YcxB family protein [Roseburia sp.]|nr:YcxB family protein [Roseburia sp.]